jgi:hypothetical protein
MSQTEISEVAPRGMANKVGGGNFEAQIDTAKKYPRSISRFMQQAQEMAVLTPDVAASCIYAIPRDGKMIEGPSARLAEIVAHAWGNLRIQASAGSDDDGRFIVGRGEAWDVESNVAIAYEVRRRITGRNNAKFSDDMIAVTGNAAASIALRNAVFKAVPVSFWKPIYNKCREVVAGKAETFHVRRDTMLKAFGVMGVTQDQIIGLLGVRGILDVTLEHMVTLTGIYNSLKEGEVSIEDAFGGVVAPIKPGERKSEQAIPAAAAAAEPAPAVAQAVEPEPEPEPATESAPVASKNIGTIDKVEPHGKSFVVGLDTGFMCSSKDPDMKVSAENIMASRRRVELITTESSDPSKFMPRLDEIVPV